MRNGIAHPDRFPKISRNTPDQGQPPDLPSKMLLDFSALEKSSSAIQKSHPLAGHSQIYAANLLGFDILSGDLA